MKRCPTSLVTGENETKTTVRYCYAPIRIVKSSTSSSSFCRKAKNKNTLHCPYQVLERMWKNMNSHIPLVGM
jgi:hypothetical protein